MSKSLVNDSFLTVGRVAEIFDRKPYTIRQWIKDGDLKATKIRNRLYIAESEVNRFAQKEFGNGSPPG